MNHPPWKQRLLDRIASDRRSERAISLASGLGENYVNQIKTTRDGVGVEALLKLCKTLNVSVAYILLGVKMSPVEQDVLTIYSRLGEDQQVSFLTFLRSLDPDGAAPR